MALKLHGIVPPLITPLTRDGDLDVEGLGRVIEHVLKGGVHAVFVLGTTGEATSLPLEARRRVIEHACRIVGDRAPVLVGVTDTCVPDSLEVSRAAADAGAAAVVVSVPYYLPPGQSELRAYAQAMVRGQPLPVVLYNIPQLTKVPYEPQTVRELSNHERVIGIKDSSGDIASFEAFRAAVDRSDFKFLVGNEGLLPQAMRHGAHGAVPGGSNIAPHLFVRLYEALAGGKPDGVEDLLSRTGALRTFYHMRPGNAAPIRAIKCAAACLKLCEPYMAPPFEPCTAEERAKIESVLRQLQLIGAPASSPSPRG